MNEITRVYIEEVLWEIHYKNSHREIADELEEHIKELHTTYIADGYPDETAWNMAINAMGSPHQLGKEFEAVHKAPADWYTWIPILGLIGINILVLLQYLNHGILQKHYIQNTLLSVILGISVIWGIRAYSRNAKEHKINWIALYTVLILTDILLTLYFRLILGSSVYSFKYLLTPFYILFLFKLADTCPALTNYKKVGFGVLLFLTMLLLSIGPKLNALLFIWSVLYILFRHWKQIKAVIATALVGAGALLTSFFAFTLVFGKEYEIQRLLSILTMRQEYQTIIQQRISNNLFHHNIAADHVYQQLYSKSGEFLFASLFHYSGVAFIILLIVSIGFYVLIYKQLDYIHKSWKQNCFLSVLIFIAIRLVYCLLMNLTGIPVVGATIPLTIGNPYAFISDCLLIGILISLKYEPCCRLDISPG